MINIDNITDKKKIIFK